MKYMDNQINKIKLDFESDLSTIKSSSDLDALYLKYFGKKGITSELLKSLQGLTLQDKKTYGPILNELKKSQESQIEQKKKVSLISSHLL
jgi:phenylalanyl-tRNA synthetase alpha chain